MTRSLLMIAARKPVAGQTKTRLGHDIGMERAERLYRAFLDDLSNRFAPRTRRTYDLAWAYTPESTPFDCVAPGDYSVCQHGDTWAERQTNLLRWGAETGFARVVLTASDSPQMSCAMVDEAFAALERADIAIGRVHDGGYYLIGSRGFHDVLTGVPMSTPDAADAVITRAGALGLLVTEVSSTFDIDIAPDLQLLFEHLERFPWEAPETLKAMQELELASDIAMLDHRR
jgi:glycosyltransferase A (GT-A) superfamily protein (DUF2064 family)